MTESGIVLYAPAGPLTLLSEPWPLLIWGYVALVTLLLATWSMVAWCLCCSATGTAQTAATQSEGCLFRLLRNPPNVAVPQERRVFGDVYHKEGPSVEGPTTEGRRLLAGPGLADHTPNDLFRGPSDKEEALASTELYDTKDIWDICSPKSQSGKSESSPESANKFPPEPPSSVPEGSQHKGPWWRELLASPVKKLRLAELGRNFRALAMPTYELPPTETPIADPLSSGKIFRRGHPVQSCPSLAEGQR